jgi:succinyl-diaminopimelate desuccinylase
VTGENEKPFAIGGSTFARAFKHGCAFGPIMKGKNNNIHDANEFITKEQLLTSYQIYKQAIFNLAEK